MTLDSAAIHQAVVLAAGRGSRLRTAPDAPPKPLHLVAGVPLLMRTIDTLADAGITRIVIVVGFMADVVRRAVAEVERPGVVVETVENPDYEKSDGVSVLAGAGVMDGPFVLSMGDHLYDAALPRLVAAADLAAADLYLAVDPRIGEVYDLDDATKIASDNGRIVDVGKTLASYDRVDTGVFAVGPALIRELRALRAERGDCVLSDGVRRLAARGRARCVDIGEAFWQDVDTPEARTRAEAVLRARLTTPS